MRVLHINSGNLFGGVETLLVTMARARGLCPALEPHFAVCFRGRLTEELAAAGVGVHLLGDVRVRRPWSIWSARRNLRALLRRQSFDAVICHAAWVQAIFGPVVRAARLPLAFWLHDPPHAVLHWLERWARRTPPDLVICNSRYTQERAARLYPHVRAELLYCPVAAPPAPPSDAERQETRAAFGAAADTTVILQVGRWAVHKGHKLHLEALGLLRDLPRWLCWQAGGAQTPAEERYQEGVRRLASSLGIADRVRFLGWQPDVSRLLRAADVYCQPNNLPEPFGISLVEALLSGLPVVTTAMGGPLEIIDDRCGILVAPGRPEVLAAGLLRLIQDGELRRRLGAGGPDRGRELCDPATQLGRLRDAIAAVAKANPVGERSSSAVRRARALC